MPKVVSERKIEDIWIITREYDGLAGAGGVKDVCRQLAETLAGSARVSVCLPCYGIIDPGSQGFVEKLYFEVDMPYVGTERREQVTVWAREEAHHRDKLTIYLIDADRYREKRSVYTYTAEEESADPSHVQGSGHYDYFAMNVLLQKAALGLMICLQARPDVIHCHDGHTALLPAMSRENEGFRHYFREAGFVVTIHNAGIGYHQEVDDLPFVKAITSLPLTVIDRSLLNGQFDPFLAAAPYAVLNTVSENYARELQETDNDELTGWLGHVLAERGAVLQGVTNGINPAQFDPSRPEELGIAAAFSPSIGDLEGKKQCRRDIVTVIESGELGSVRRSGSLDERPGQPLFTLIGRFTPQKGVDKLAEALEMLLPRDGEFQVLVLGTGEREIEERLIRLCEQQQNNGRLCVLQGFDQQLATKIYAAGDFFLIPSRYEPCGLTDYIAQLFGNLPIVHHIGGLVKVEDGRNGFAYHEHSAQALMEAMERALRVYREHPEQIQAMQRQSIELIHEKYAWDKIVLRYIKLYGEALRFCTYP